MERKTYLFNAKGKVLGRLATDVARILRGKDRVDYTPHIDAGGRVVIINAQDVVLTGNKETDKKYYRFSGYPGGIKGITVKQQREKDARRIVEQAVRGMLPKNKLSRGMLTRLFIYNDDTYKQQIDIEQS